MNRESKIIWGLVKTKDGYEYKKGEVIEVSLYRRSLLMRKGKSEKVIKITTINY